METWTTRSSHRAVSHRSLRFVEYGVKKKKWKNDFTFSEIEDLSFPFIINEDVHPERDFL